MTDEQKVKFDRAIAEISNWMGDPDVGHEVVAALHESHNKAMRILVARRYGMAVEPVSPVKES